MSKATYEDEIDFDYAAEDDITWDSINDDDWDD